MIGGQAIQTGRRWHRDFSRGLASYFRFEEASGTRMDQVGNDNLAPVNSPGNAAGKHGNAVSLVGASAQYLTKGSCVFNPSSTQHWSMACWVKPTSFSNYCIIHRGANGGDRKITFIDVSGTLYRYNGLNFGVGLTTGVWTHVGYTFESQGTDTGVETGYINGAKVATRTGAVVAPDATATLLVGFNGSTRRNDGLIDSLGLWVGRVLSPVDMAVLAVTPNDVL